MKKIKTKDLQDKFEEIIKNNIECSYSYSTLMYEDKAAKECAKLCLEEQIKLLTYIISEINEEVFTITDIHLSAIDILNNLQQQLKELENGTTNSK